MKKHAAVLLVFLGLFSFSNTSEEEKIAWNENRKLTWEDFKGTPNRADEFVASTNSGVSFGYSYKERNGIGKVEITIQSNFYPNLSWYRSEKVSDYILAHEQLHFDISELHARKLRKALAPLPHNRAYKAAAEAIYNNLEADRRAMQESYDRDSDHSNEEVEEYKWRAYVAQELEKYNDWK